MYCPILNHWPLWQDKIFSIKRKKAEHFEVLFLKYFFEIHIIIFQMYASHSPYIKQRNYYNYHFSPSVWGLELAFLVAWSMVTTCNGLSYTTLIRFTRIAEKQIAMGIHRIKRFSLLQIYAIAFAESQSLCILSVNSN